MLPKEERRAMLLRLYNDDSPLLDHSKGRFDNEAPAPTSEEFNDAEIEAEATAKQDEKLQFEQARNDTVLRDEDDDEDLEDGGVAIDNLAEKTMVTRAEGRGNDAVMESYGTSMGDDNPSE